MLAVVLAALRIAPRRRWPALARYQHALAGLIVAACGAGMVAGY